MRKKDEDGQLSKEDQKNLVNSEETTTLMKEIMLKLEHKNVTAISRHRIRNE